MRIGTCYFPSVRIRGAIMIRADVIRALSGSTVRAPARIMPTYREWDSLAVGPQPIYPVKVRLSFTELRRTAP